MVSTKINLDTTWMSVIVGLFVILCLNHSVNCSHICYGTDEDLLKDRLSTKTEYFFAHKDNSFVNKFNEESEY